MIRKARERFLYCSRALLCQVDYLFLLAFSLFCKLCSAAPGMGDIGHDIVGLLEHPLVTPWDCEAKVDGFDALREHGVGVVAGIKLVSLWGQTLQNDGITDMGVYGCQLFQNRAHNTIKCSLLTNIKHIYGMVLKQIDQHLTQFRFNWTRSITMPEESTDRHFLLSFTRLTSITDIVFSHYSIR